MNMTDDTGKADHTNDADRADDAAPPDYALDEVRSLSSPEEHRALFEDTRMQIVSALSERAATTSELSHLLDRPKGTIGHHLKVLEAAGLVRVVRRKRVRALEAKYYGRTARVFLYGREGAGARVPEQVIDLAAAELAQVPHDHDGVLNANIRHVRVPAARAEEFSDRLNALLQEFADSPRGGTTTYALAFALYPSPRPPLGSAAGEGAET